MTTQSTVSQLAEPETSSAYAMQQGYTFIAIESFLYDCRARGLSQDLIENYKHELTPFMDYCAAWGASKLTDLSCELLSGYLLALSKRCNPAGVQAAAYVLALFSDWVGCEEIHDADGEGQAE